MRTSPSSISTLLTSSNSLYSDTLKNVKGTGEFTVQIISEWFLESANHTCGNFRFDVNEFQEAGLTMVDSSMVRPPRVAESAVQFECKLEELFPMKNAQGDVTATLVIGRVVLVHYNKNVYNEETGEICPEKYLPVGRMGGNYYATIGKIIEIPRPKVEGLKAL